MKYLILSTRGGDIKIELLHASAPKTCATIEKLVQGGHYNDCVFYRAEPNFVLQGGLTTSKGEKRKSPFGGIPLEVKEKNKRGTVTLARWEEATSGEGEFFINLGDSPHLDKTGDAGWALGFAVWGRVVAGLDVADRLSAEPTQVKGGLKMLVAPIVFKARLE